MTDETIFAVALEKPDAAERAAYLDSACAGDPEQRRRVEGLLAALEAAGGFLEKPAVAQPDPDLGPTRDFHTPGAAAGDATTRAEGEGDDDTDDALGFLAPAGRPDSLGRIGHYEVLEVLGRGGFGIVFRAFDERLQRVVAVKVLSPAMAATSPARKRFLREARSAALIQHENVVRIHETGEEPLPYLVMEFVPGETLQARLDRTGPLEAPEALKIARQVAAGLAGAHDKGLIHRDIKPSNILIDSGPGQQVKITDFGLARAADDASLTRSGVVAGTPMYMAPEQAKGEALDHRADLFSLGSVLYAMLTGRPPFRAETTLAVLKRVAEDTPRPIREVIPEVPEWFCRIVEKLHAKDPAERFQTAREVAELLADCEKQLAAHKELRDTSRIPEGKARKPARREPRSAVLFVVVFLVGVAAFAVVGAVGAMMWWLMMPVVSDGVRVDPVGPPDPQVGMEPVPPAADFVQLFNGKDLTGWTASRNSPGNWRVEDGVLVGRQGPGYLFSAKAYDNFHLRVEAKVNAAGNSGVSFGRRHQVEIRHDPLCPTGSLLEFEPGKAPSITRYPHSQPAPDTWFELEIKVEGASAAVRIDRGPWHTSRVARADGDRPSPLELEALDAETVVHFRKIEIKELPSKAPEEQAKEDAARLNGEWVVRTGKVDGLPLAAEDNEEMKLFLQNGKFTLPIRDDSGYPWALTGIYTIDAAKKQLAFKFNHEPQDTPPVLCSYRFEGDTLVLDFPEPKDGQGGTEPFARDRRLVSQRNLKNIGIAMHSYADAHGDALPPAAITNPKDKDGKPLLSWRVALLPYLGEEKLYKQFKLDEPWDGEHNKKLIEKMPKVFKTPGVKAEPGITHYRVFVGPGTAFEPRPAGAKGLRLVLDFPDGMSNTILVAEAATEPMVWTKPDDLPYDPKKPLPKLVGADSVGMHVLMADGSVWQILPKAWPAGIRDAIVRNNRDDGVGPWDKAAWNRLFRRIPPHGPAVYLEFQRAAAAPPPAVAPFDAKQAKEHQERWAKHLGVPVEHTNSVGMKFRLIPPGEFHMGSSAGEIEKLLADEKETAKFLVNAEGPRRSVRISSPYYMGTFEVTQAEYLRVMGTNPSHFARSGKAADKVEGLDTEKLGFPVENVSWDDTVEFCRKLSELPEERAAGRVYRLATEAQWEYACRAGTAGRFHTGDALGEADANFDLSLGRPEPVGKFPANAFGLHDMHGNVFEWCADWFAGDYRDLPPLDPQGPATGEARVVRGGNYAYRDRYCRSAARDRFQPVAKRGGIGFRVVIVGDLRPKPNAKKGPDQAVVQPLKDAVAARERSAADAKTRFELGKVSSLDVLAAEVDLTEARIKLAVAEGDKAAVVARLEELVKHRSEERELVKSRVDAGIDRTELLDQADFRLAEAKARLAKVAPPAVAPPPREK